MEQYINYYLIGLVLTLLFLIFLGKKLFKCNYDEPKDYVNAEEWSSNAEAYVAWSILWVITVPVVALFAIYKLIVKLVKILIKCFQK